MSRTALRTVLVVMTIAFYILMAIQHRWVILAIAVLIGWPWAFVEWRNRRSLR